MLDQSRVWWRRVQSVVLLSWLTSCLSTLSCVFADFWLRCVVAVPSGSDGSVQQWWLAISYWWWSSSLSPFSTWSKRKHRSTSWPGLLLVSSCSPPCRSLCGTLHSIWCTIIDLSYRDTTSGMLAVFKAAFERHQGWITKHQIQRPKSENKEKGKNSPQNTSWNTK